MPIDTPAEPALFALRAHLQALGVPADDLPDDLVPVVAGGSLMPSLPGWTPARARDWAAVAARWPELARRVVAWCDANAGRLANLGEVRVLEPDTSPPRLYLDLISEPFGDIIVRRNHVRGTVDPRGIDRGLCPAEEWRAGRAVEYELEARLGTLNRLGRPWHAELAAAVAAARRGDRPATDFHLTDWTRSHDGLWPQPSTIVPVYPLEAVAVVRVVPPSLVGILGHTNAAPFCGAEPDEMILQSLNTDRVEHDSRPGPRIRLTYHFGFRPGYPWSRFPSPDGAWRILQDENRYRPFEPADFFELP